MANFIEQQKIASNDSMTVHDDGAGDYRPEYRISTEASGGDGGIPTGIVRCLRRRSGCLRRLSASLHRLKWDMRCGDLLYGGLSLLSWRFVSRSDENNQGYRARQSENRREAVSLVVDVGC